VLISIVTFSAADAAENIQHVLQEFPGASRGRLRPPEMTGFFCAE